MTFNSPFQLKLFYDSESDPEFKISSQLQPLVLSHHLSICQMSSFHKDGRRESCHVCFLLADNIAVAHLQANQPLFWHALPTCLTVMILEDSLQCICTITYYLVLFPLLPKKQRSAQSQRKYLWHQNCRPHVTATGHEQHVLFFSFLLCADSLNRAVPPE